MNKADAKRILAGYLTGRDVSKAALSEACRTLGEDGAYARDVRRTLGFGDSPPLCDVFRLRVAEFSELSFAQKEARMPELVRHYQTCPECRVVYWAVKPVWAEQARADLRILTEPIRLGWNRAGEFVQEGFGWPGAVLRPVYRTADTPGNAPERREWLVVVDEAASRGVIVAVTPRSVGRVGIEIATQAAPTEPWVAALRLAVIRKNPAPDYVLFAGRLSILSGKEVEIGPGTWSIEIKSGLAADSPGWVFPLVVSESGGTPEGGKGRGAR